MPHKIFNNNLVAICKSKATLILNKPAYIGICILELRKVLMHDSIMITLKTNAATTQNHFLQTMIIYCMKLKLTIFNKILAATKKYLILVIIRLNQNILMI